ncbi:PREDICTED: histone-lysine N-methyltransferase, H3 lysine-79 specific [Bactrocera latifrons]|nr:PREDICTED: histone-lysine N-methyltransferase, H3 lysine-79 specific [Bactrocera latifrons]
MATPQVKDLVLRSPAGSSEVITFAWPLQVGSGQDKHDNGIDIIDTIKFVCEELPSISSAFEEINLNQIDTACYKTMTNLVDRFNKAVDSIVALEKGTSLPAERLNKFAHPSLLRHILQLVYNAAVLDPDKLNNYEPFSPEVYGETSYELVQQMIKHVNVTNDDTFIDLGSGVGQVVLQMAGSFPLKACVGIEKADTPARYAERMDMFFRQFMAWFGKRYCDYKLIKGDFLVDEHREKITSSSLVFVNNFAFGPNVDHQLKERFADLRDGARIVSSKSFCPLNFRITDRNLSDIGTIMHVSEIPPLKGSVSWTCKPVSYYLHTIDRTILERYFQRLKTQKGAENDHVGSTRTTRDRAKREAHNHALNNHHNHHHHNNNSNSNTHSNSSAANSSSTNTTNSNSSSSNSTQRTNSPAAHVSNNSSQAQQSNATAPTTTTSAATSKTTRNQQQQQQQAQRNNLDMDTSTESEAEGDVANGSATGGTANGPTTRKIWSDWCSSSKGKSSQSDDEENNNNFRNTVTATARNARTVPQKKRKKLTRKAAIASKSAAAAAAQREAAAAAREAAAQEAAMAAAAANSKDSSSKEDAGAGSGGGGARGRKGRMKKGARGRKSLKIAGLDVLHKQTLLSTSHEVLSKKLPAAPGCVDQQLTSLLTRNMTHTELEIPEAPQDTPYALQILLDVFRTQYMAMIEQMKAKSFVPNIKRQIQLEQERKQRIKNRASQLDKQIKVLIDDSVMLLKARMNELGINVTSPNDLITKAKEIVGRHKELQGIAKKIQSQVTTCELEQKRLLKKHLQHLPEYQKTCGNNGRTKVELPNGGNPIDLSETAAHELVLKEIANTLAQRKKLYAQVSSIEKEAALLEKAAEERRTAAALLAQGTNMTLANTTAVSSGAPTMMPATLISAGTSGVTQPLQLTTTSGASAGGNAVSSCAPATPSKSVTNATSKTSRRSRDHRTRSQEWPDVPDVGKIEESNPEVLAQKILETGRQIEAGKFSAATGTGNSYNNAMAGAGIASGKQLALPTTAHHQHLNNNNIGQYHDEVLTTQSKKKQHARSSSNEHIPSVSIYVADSNLMPAPTAANKQQPQQQSSPVNGNGLRGVAGLLPKCELPGARKSSMSAAASGGIQESPKVANFEDRLKSIITSALNEDQEHRKAAAHHMPGSSAGHDLSIHSSTQSLVAQQSGSLQSSPAPKRSKHSVSASSMNNINQQAHPHQQMQMHHQQHPHHNHLPPLPPQAMPQNNLSNLITVATQGPTHLNATTTISPITPPPSIGNSQYGSTGVGAGKYGGSKQQSSAASGSHKGSAAKYQQQQNNAHLQQQQQQQHLTHLQQQHAHFGPAVGAGTSPADLAFHHRRRSSVSAASFEHYAAQQQQQHQQAMMMAAAAAAAGSASSQHHASANHQHLMPPLEFKAPTVTAENLILNASQRSNSREQLVEEVVVAPRSSSANSDSAIMYYPPTRDRLMSLERSNSRESAVSQPLPPHHTNSGSGGSSGQQMLPQPSRPSSNSSQPDYTQVSPAKMALRRHLSQEKLNQQMPPAGAMSGLPLSTKTIGDLVNGEIERTLEISHQSIINAAVNMSTVGAPPPITGATNVGANNYMDRAAHDRLLINPNAQRPERVHVRVFDEQMPPTHMQGNAVDVSPRTIGAGNGRKSPPTTPTQSSHNMSSLAHVAYNHKTATGGTATAAPPNSGRVNNSSGGYNPSLYQQMAMGGGSSNGREATNARLAASGNVGGAGSGSRSRDYQPVSLPRAEMKGCIEAYFNDEQHHQQQQHQQHQQQQQQHHNHQTQSHKAGSKERNNGRGNRLNGSNPPLEGLAASLQDHVMASRKYKEEHEERQRRAAAVSSNNSDMHNQHHHQQHPHQQQQQQYAHSQHHHYQAQAALGHNNNATPNKVEIGVKRTSPMANNQQPRPAKMAHYNDNAVAHNQQLHQHQQHHLSNSNPYANMNGVSSSSNSGAIASATGAQTQSQSSLSPSCRRNAKLPLEPLLMSPEINSIMSGGAAAGGDERPLQLSATAAKISRQQQQQLQHEQQSRTATTPHSTTPIVGGRAGDDDDVIADDETHWQHRVSSGFDRLVAFASTELDKTRRSIDTDIVPSSISCNTSPDSGITHSSSSNSDTARTFLSTSSTSSQLDMPMSSGGSSAGSTSSSSGCSVSGVSASSGGSGVNSYMHGHLHHHHHHHSLLLHAHGNGGGGTTSSHASSSDHLSDSSMKSTHSDVASMPPITLLKANSASPVDASAIDSPPLSDIGLPRTPSPNAAVPTPPLAAAMAAAHSVTPTPTPTPTPPASAADPYGNSTLKIPLKYQRKSKSSSEKHYKKKFCERNWEYDCDDLLMPYANNNSNDATNSTVIEGSTANDAVGKGMANVMKNAPTSFAKTNGGETKKSHQTSPEKSPKRQQQQQQQNASEVNNTKSAETLNHNHNSNNSLSSTTSATTATMQNLSHHHHHHKSSKFRPKGKDWDWSMDSSNSSSNVNINSSNSGVIGGNSSGNKCKADVGAATAVSIAAPTTTNVS